MSLTPARATVCLTFDFDAISLWIGSFGATSPSAISRGEFGVVGFMYRDVPGGVLILTMHPEVIGRGHRLLMLERLLALFAQHDGVRFATLGQVVDEFRATHPRPRGGTREGQ